MGGIQKRHESPQPGAAKSGGSDLQILVSIISINSHYQP